MVEEFEGYTRSFWSAVHEHTERGALNLDDLPERSPLEMCYLLVRAAAAAAAYPRLHLHACQA
jgi:hypothetical protein